MVRSPRKTSSKRQSPKSSGATTIEITFYPEDGKTYRPFRSPARLKAMDDKKNRGNEPVARIDGIPEKFTGCWAPVDGETREVADPNSSAPVQHAMDRSAEHSSSTTSHGPGSAGFGSADRIPSQFCNPTLRIADTAQDFASGYEFSCQQAMQDQALLSAKVESAPYRLYDVNDNTHLAHAVVPTRTRGLYPIDTSVCSSQDLASYSSLSSAYVNDRIYSDGSSDGSSGSPSQSILETPASWTPDAFGNISFDGQTFDSMNTNWNYPSELQLDSRLHNEPESAKSLLNQASQLSLSDNSHQRHMGPFEPFPGHDFSLFWNPLGKDVNDASPFSYSHAYESDTSQGYFPAPAPSPLEQFDMQVPQSTVNSGLNTEQFLYPSEMSNAEFAPTDFQTPHPMDMSELCHTSANNALEFQFTSQHVL